MKKVELPKHLLEKYKIISKEIKSRLAQFKEVPSDKYFYELCFCICTPQSKAKSALAVQEILEANDYLNNSLNLSHILNNKENYIRFHNQKALRLDQMKEKFDSVMQILQSQKSSQEKRLWLNDNIKGIGMKESAHYLRNIGYSGLAILDRHILKHLIGCGVYEESPNISSKKNYLLAEEKFLKFADDVKIPIDELDLLFWSEEAGEIIK